MKVSFEGLGELVASFVNGGDALKGKLVKLSANSTVAAATDGEVFAGMCIHADDAFAEVVLSGCVTCTYSGTAPAVGYVKLVSAGNGAVKTAAGGREYLVLKVDEAASTVSFVM